MIVKLRKASFTSPFLTWFSIIGGRLVFGERFAVRALEVGELDHFDRSARVAEDHAVLRDPGQAPVDFRGALQLRVAAAATARGAEDDQHKDDRDGQEYRSGGELEHAGAAVGVVHARSGSASAVPA